MKRKNRSTARFKKLSKQLIRLANRTISVERLATLCTRMNTLTKIMNDTLNKNPKYFENGFKPVSPTVLLKKCQWWEDQEPIRAFAISGSRDFTCHFSKEILDSRDSFLICGRVVSSKGVDIMIKQKGFGILGGISV